MDILCNVLVILWFGFLVACCIGYVVGVAWLIYQIVKLGDEIAGERKNGHHPY